MHLTMCTSYPDLFSFAIYNNAIPVFHIIFVYSTSTFRNNLYIPHSTLFVTVFAQTNHLAHFIIIEISTALCNDCQADSTDLFGFLIEPAIPKL